MFDLKAVRLAPGAFDAALARRGLAPSAAALVALDDARRAAIAACQPLQERRNAASREIAAAMRDGEKAVAEALKAEVGGLKAAIAAAEGAEREAADGLRTAMAALPNAPTGDVPDGADESENVEIRRFGAAPAFPEGFVPREHFDIGERLGLMDFESAARTSGARFVFLKGPLARLSRALMQFMLDLHADAHGYVEVEPPLLVRDEAMFGTAQLPKFRDDQFPAGDGFWLVPTAEVPLTNLVRERIVDAADLPLRLVAGTSCFRAEAGAAGRDARGMIRQHQFNKVEMVSIVAPEEAVAEHARMTACAEEVLRRLGLHYRTVVLCVGDLGFSARKTHDVEVWLPGQNRFREISSCSWCGDFQARRMDARYRDAAGALRFVHTLNGSGVAVGRALVAVLENYQRPDGSVVVPEVLRPYMGGLGVIGA